MSNHTLSLLLSVACAALVLAGCDRHAELCPGGVCAGAPDAGQLFLAPGSGPEGGGGPSTATCVLPGAGLVVLNEVLADPSGTDINGDGVADAHEDEFIELLNTSGFEVDLTGMSVQVGDRVVHTFGPRCLAARTALVLFGGGTPVALDGPVAVADYKLKLTNSGSQVVLLAHDNAVLDGYAYGAEGDGAHSLARHPDGTGTWAPHPTSDASTDGATAHVAHSAGRCTNYAAFPDCDPGHADLGDDRLADPPQCPNAGQGDLVINEIMADPAGFDANGDGLAKWQHDEFVEVLVTADSERRLSEVALYINGAERLVFPAGCYGNGSAFVVFGGGAPMLNLSPTTQVLVADKNLGLTNNGSTVVLRRKDNAVIDHHTYKEEGGMDQSLTRYPDGWGAFYPHSETPGGRVASPGLCALGEELVTGCLSDSDMWDTPPEEE